MPDKQLVAKIRRDYRLIVAELDERGRRRWAALQARSLGWGGVTTVALATGISDRTIRNGIAELDEPEPLVPERQRRPGAGRSRKEQEIPELLEALDALVEPISTSVPVPPLRWTCKSTRALAGELGLLGFTVSSTKVGSLLKAQGYSLQSNRKTVADRQHPDRHAQFEFVAQRVKARWHCGEPAISVDTNKKGPVKMQGLPDKAPGNSVPDGMHAIASNGNGNGVCHETAEFAILAIRRWWQRMGRERFGTPRRILITADCGESNSRRTRLWLWELQQMANRTGIIYEVCHYPAGTSKWNGIEHQLFCKVANWRGKPLETLEVVVALIGTTKASAGQKVHASLNGHQSENRRKIALEDAGEVQIQRNEFHGEWNYEIHPQAR